MSNRNPLLDEKLMRIEEADSDGCDVRAKIAIDIIRQEYSRSDLSLDRLAKRLGVSRWHLSRLFKKNTGSGVKERLNKVRMREAEKLLSSTELRIKEAAFAVGYNQASDFNRHFKSTFGISPREYRKRILRFNFKKAEQEFTRMTRIHKKQQKKTSNFA